MLSLAIARSTAPPTADAGDDAVAPAWLGEAERARWFALADGAREAFAASRALLRRLLESTTGIAADDWQVTAQAGTAPVAALRWPVDGPVDAVPVASLAHRLGWVAAAVAPSGGGRVGVDIECARPPRSDPRERAALMLGADELARWHALPESAREDALLRAWTAKEAFFKAAPAGDAPWDFRRLAAVPSEPARANVRLWAATSAPVQVALCSDDATALAAAVLQAPEDVAFEPSSFWRVSRVG